MNESPENKQHATIEAEQGQSLQQTSLPGETEIEMNSAQSKGENALQLLDAVRTVAPNLLADVFHSDRFPTHTEMIPAVIGRFQIVRELGRGAHGVVFMAHDPTLRRDIALKVPRPGAILSADLQRRFEREAKAAALLDHPNIVPIHEFGSVGPVSFIASSLSGGIPLDQWRKANSCNEQLVARIMEALAAAVQHAHTRGVLHRDIKPANILIDDANSDEERWSSLQLTDFGLAQVEWDAGQTQSNTILGTPAFMAPEQAAGQQDAIGPATDIYALGATLYFLLTMQPPISRDTSVATLQAIQHVDPKSPRSLDPTISSDLEAICQKCLEKKTANRYSTADELRADLNRFVTAQTVSVRPVGLARQFQRWVERNQSLAIALGTLATVLVGATIVSTSLWMSANRQTREARSQARWSRLAVEQLLSSIANDPTVQHGGGLERFREQLLSLSTAYLEEAANMQPNDPQVSAEYFRSVEQLTSSISKLGEFDRAIKMRDTLLNVSDDGLNLTPEQRADLLFGQATDHAALGNVDQAVAASTAACALFQVSSELTDSNTESVTRGIRQLTSLSGSLINKGDLPEADAAIAGAMEFAQSLHGEEVKSWTVNKELARLIKTKCAVALRMGQWDDVTELAPIGILAYEKLLIDDVTFESAGWTSLASLYKSWSAALIESGQLKLADEPLELEFQYVDRLLKKHPDMPALIEMKYSNAIRRGSLQLKKGKLDEAHIIARETMTSIQSTVEDHPQLRQTLADELNDCQSILAFVASESSLNSSDSSFHALMLKQISTLEEACAKPEHAIDLEVKLGRALANLAFAYVKSSQNELAIATYKRSWKYLQSSIAAGAEPGEASTALVAVSLNYRNALLKSGRIDEALHVSEECLELFQNGQQGEKGYDSATLRVRPMVVNLLVSRVDLSAAQGLVDQSVACAENLLKELQSPQEQLELALAVGHALAREQVSLRQVRTKLTAVAHQCLVAAKTAGLLEQDTFRQAVKQGHWDSMKHIDELTSFFSWPSHDSYH